MTYEFAPEEAGFDAPRPTAPEFWRNRIDRIYKLPPNEPTWVSYFSVNIDPQTHEYGVDTNDQLQFYPQNAPFPTSYHPVGLMKIWLEVGGGNPDVEGYLVDLRRAQNVTEREDMTFEKNEDNIHKTVPALAVVQQEGSLIHLRSPYRRHPALELAAIGMMSYFDSDYETRYGVADSDENEVEQDVASLDDAPHEGR